jgi:DNA-directed RNA polymerase II subunit RPB11|mmetsp:Transcript_7271/g.13042  ORF Transcript_7271/g.13042 Transcript_7271/m.13042 type:complete len:130 (+) Transcript_7271:25-414(+)
MNAPERAAAFLLDEDIGEVKLEYKADTKVSNAGTFIFQKEDHTVSNLLRMQLLRDPAVRFAGYMMPHPLIHRFDMKIQTSSSTVAPVEVLSAAIEDLANETDHLITQTTDAIDKWRKENDTGVMSQYSR